MLPLALIQSLEETRLYLLIVGKHIVVESLLRGLKTGRIGGELFQTLLADHDEDRLHPFDVLQHPRLHIKRRMDIIKEQVGRGRLAIGPDIELRHGAIDPDPLIGCCFGTDLRNLLAT